jgi:predicted enzyme related to lactoylglutathione lyase
MARLLINIDVEDLDAAAQFYCTALELRVGRRFGSRALELLGGEAPLYLLARPAGSQPIPMAHTERTYQPHWTPVHLDFAVTELEAALARAQAAGATLEHDISEQAYGRIAVLRDPFGHGFCLLEFSARGYDAITTG